MTYRAQRRIQDQIQACSTVVSPKLAPYDYFLVDHSLAAFAIFQRHCQFTTEAPHSLWGHVSLHHHPCAVERLPEHLTRMCRTTYLFHGSNRLYPPILVVSFRRASSASDETSAGAAAQFSWLCPSPCWVRHLRSPSSALSLSHAHHPHPPQRRKMQDHSELSPIATIISWNVSSDSLFINPTFSAFLLSSCSCWTAACASSTQVPAPVVSLSSKSSMHCSFLKKCVSARFSAASFFLDRQLPNAPKVQALCASKPLLPSFVW